MDTGLIDRLARIEAVFALRLQGEVDHHDGVLLHDADQQHHPDQRDQAEFGAEEEQRENGARTRRGQRREDRNGVDVALIENAQHDVDADDGGKDQQRLVADGLLEQFGRARESTVDGKRRVDLLHRAVDGSHGIADGFALREVERESRGHERALMIDR